MNQDLFQYFKLHIGCEVLVRDMDGRYFRDKLLSVIDNRNGKFVCIHDWGELPIDSLSDHCQSFQLILRPIWTMTNEQILELCSLASPIAFGDYRYSKWEIERATPWDDNQKVFLVKNANAEYFYNIDCLDGEITMYDKVAGDHEPLVLQPAYWQWYLKHHFDVNVLPENKTLIELGLAVDESSELVNSI